MGEMFTWIILFHDILKESEETFYTCSSYLMNFCSSCSLIFLCRGFFGNFFDIDLVCLFVFFIYIFTIFINEKNYWMVEDKREREKIRQPSHISFLHYLLICHSNGIKLKDWRRKHILTIFLYWTYILRIFFLYLNMKWTIEIIYIKNI